MLIYPNGHCKKCDEVEKVPIQCFYKRCEDALNIGGGVCLFVTSIFLGEIGQGVEHYKVQRVVFSNNVSDLQESIMKLMQHLLTVARMQRPPR